MSSRREPLLWLQCLSIGAMPLEILLLRLVLAGADVGPVPSLERLFTWAIGGLIPAFLLWKRSPDWGSLLLVRQPLAKRSPFQRKLSAAQTTLPLKLVGAAGALLLLLILWWIDGSALLVADLSPLHNGSRLGSLLLAAPVLALLLWQWQQLIQAAWLLTREDSTLSALTPLNDAELQSATTSFGLGVLQLDPLDWEAPLTTSMPPTQQSTATISQPEESNANESDSECADDPEDCSANETASELMTSPVANAVDVDGDDAEPSSQQFSDSANPEQASPEPSFEISENELVDPSTLTVAVEPEQAAEEDHSSDLDRQVADHDGISSADSEAHDEQSETSGTEQSEPEQPPETSPGGA